jgi:2-keto-4-pentenoate hydratase
MMGIDPQPCSDTEQAWARALYASFITGAHGARTGAVQMPGTPPADMVSAYRIQRAFQQSIGPRGGWKVGAANPTAEPLRACLPAALIQHGAGRLAANACWPGGIEAEIAFRVGRDLPVAGGPYTREQVIDSLDTAHVAIEVLSTRQSDPERVDPNAKLADLLFNGHLIVGPGTRHWRTLDLAQLPITVSVDGEPLIAQHGGNPAGDPLRLIHWLANALDAEDGGLVAGEIITTGSWIGAHQPLRPATFRVQLAGIGDVALVPSDGA